MSAGLKVESLGPRTLTGRFIALEPLAPEHRDALRAAANDPALWRFMPMDASGEGFGIFWDLALAETARGNRIAFAVRRLSDNALVGSTSYLAIVPDHARVEIGFTWYVAGAQGSAVNPEAKFLLMQNAFETAGYNRVELKTDSTNARSRTAILKLDAKEESIMRAHMWMHRGYWRDTVYYSVLRDEWPGVKAGLEKRLED